MDWTFWFYWIIATTAGWIAGYVFSSAIPIAISGVAVSAMQWAVLYKRFPNSWRWFVFSATAWIFGYLLFVITFSSSNGIMLGPILGLAVAIPQWFILRNEIDWSGWWFPISILAWTTGLSVMPGLFSSGALPGALTGLSLVILFRFSDNQNKL